MYGYVRIGIKVLTGEIQDLTAVKYKDSCLVCCTT